MKLPHFLLLCACVFSAGLVLAQGNGRAYREDRGNDRGSPGQRQDLNRERPDHRERYERFEPQHDQRGQMNDEERRQLRRDVNDAGREIYRRPER